MSKAAAAAARHQLTRNVSKTPAKSHTHKSIHTMPQYPDTAKPGRNPFAPPSATEQHAEFRATKTKTTPTRAAHNSHKSRPRPTTKSAIEQAHEHLRNGQSRADENLQKLLLFSAPVRLDAGTTDKLIRRAQSGRYVIAAPMAVAADEATAFTEEDFAKFEREYFCS